MKRAFAQLLTLAMLVSLSGCSVLSQLLSRQQNSLSVEADPPETDEEAAVYEADAAGEETLQPEENTPEAPAQPELPTVDSLLPYVELYNSCLRCHFGAEFDDSVIYHRLYASEDAMINGEAPIGVIGPDDPQYDACGDPTCASVYLVTNFNSISELKTYLRGYMTELAVEFLSTDMDYGLLEMNGQLYIVFGSMGYGATLLNTENCQIVEQSDTICTLAVDTLYFEESIGDSTLYFILEDGVWKLDGANIVY